MSTGSSGKSTSARWKEKHSSGLLTQSGLAVSRLHYPAGASPYFLVCDHASRRLPRTLGSLGLSSTELKSHIAWDIGAAGLASRLAEQLQACLLLQTYSRLVIDCNRPLGTRDSIATLSERTRIPGNEGLSCTEAAIRAQAIFSPYHNRLRAALDARRHAERPTLLVALHSFTPTFLGVNRPWHLGVLYHRDARLSQILLDLLRREKGVIVGDNEPYAMSDDTDYTLVVHGEQRGIPHIELEVRQDLIADVAGQTVWALRLARLLSEAATILLPHCDVFPRPQ
jgi:predicted N-formylglutamate amidohydrolase